MRSPVIGYVFDRDGKYQYKWMFEGTMKNMASFIMTHADSDTMITDMGDRPLVTSMRGGWLDRVCNSEFRKELMRELEPLQNYSKEPEILEFEQDGGYMIQKNVREASIMPDQFPQDCYPYEIPAEDRTYTCMAIFSEEEGKSTAWYVELVEEDGFIVTADEDMWRGESIENVMEHSSIKYRPFWLNDVESNVLEPLCKETAELIYLDPDICDQVNTKYEYEMESELLPGIDKVMNYSADDGSYKNEGVGFGFG